MDFFQRPRVRPGPLQRARSDHNLVGLWPWASMGARWYDVNFENNHFSQPNATFSKGQKFKSISRRKSYKKDKETSDSPLAFPTIFAHHATQRRGSEKSCLRLTIKSQLIPTFTHFPRSPLSLHPLPYHPPLKKKKKKGKKNPKIPVNYNETNQRVAYIWH